MKRKNREPVAESSIRFFKNGIRSHMMVDDIIDVGKNQYLIKRYFQRPNIKIILADIYIAGEADIFEINPKLNDLDCIVLIGFMNSYSSDAKEIAKSMNVGLFNNREFFGALHYSGKEFIDYTKRVTNEKD